MLTVKQVAKMPDKMAPRLLEMKFPEQGVVWDMCVEHIGNLPVSMTLNRQKLLGVLGRETPLMEHEKQMVANTIISELHNLWEVKND